MADQFMMSLRALPMMAGMAMALASAPASAVTYLGTFSGNDCGGSGGFANCYATQTGTQQGAPTNPNALGSPVIYKSGPDGTDFGSFKSITGSEFSITYASATNTLSFTYNPGAGDPAIHYFDIKQANGYALFYDSNAITSGSINLTTYFPKNPGYSHISFFDTGSVNAVPEPGSWALMLLGFGGMGTALRRVRRRDGHQLRTA